jgi:hypothetical protein
MMRTYPQQPGAPLLFPGTGGQPDEAVIAGLRLSYDMQQITVLKDGR